MQVKKRLFIKPFLSYDKVAMERYLEKQAQKGWLLDRSKKGWVFYRTQSKTLRFSVYYFPEAHSYHPELTLRQEEFLELCAHDGWELAKNLPGMLVLCNENPNPTPIETDPVMEVENIGKLEPADYKRLLTWMLGRLFFLGFYIIRGIRDAVGLEFPHSWGDPGLIKTDFYSSTLLLLSLLWFIAIPVFAGLWWIPFRLWYRKAHKLAKEEGRFYTPQYRINPIPWLWMILTAGSILALYLADAANYWLLLLLFACLWAAGVLGTNAVLKNLDKALWLRVIAGMAVGGLLLVPLPYLVYSPAVPGSLGAPEKHPVECTCPGAATSHIRNQEELPLLVQDLTEDAGEETVWSTYWTGQSSPLLGKYYGQQQPCCGDFFTPRTTYSIYHIKVNAPWLYDICLEEVFYTGDWKEGNSIRLNPKSGSRYQAALEDPSLGVQIYQRHNDNGPQSDYVLLFETRIVDLDPPWLLTDEQLAKAAEILGSCALPNT